MIFAETERLILRRAREEDLEPLVRSWSDPEMTRYTERKPDVRAFLVEMIADMQVKLPGEMEPGGPWYQFMVERREDGLLVGDIGVGFGIPGERQVELGYRILPQFHRRGYAHEAVAAAIGYLIAEHGIHRFVAVAAALNQPSGALLRSLGFRQEGHFRQSFLCNGEWLDDHYYALLASDWRG
ncbi:MAG TPA: GNAT family N-acetyltransferase [Allosphingosinicella sp.]|nr:GNAT family N-acetyltransferase [Allosphingosinicella sp.]